MRIPSLIKLDYSTIEGTDCEQGRGTISQEREKRKKKERIESHSFQQQVRCFSKFQQQLLLWQ